MDIYIFRWHSSVDIIFQVIVYGVVRVYGSLTFYQIYQIWIIVVLHCTVLYNWYSSLCPLILTIMWCLLYMNLR